MASISFQPVPFDGLDTADAPDKTVWLWNGYVALGNLTLLTSMWKAGKTTLVTGMLRQLVYGGSFLGRQCLTAKVLVVSEESRQHWATRMHTLPVGPHVKLLARPFRGRPSLAEWNDLIDHASEQRAAGQLDLLVVDPLSYFLPGHSENDAGTLVEMLHPLQRLASEGMAVLLLHHPRKKPSEEGSSARGSGALLGFVDIIVELRRYGRFAADQSRRKLTALSRFDCTPDLSVYEWNQATGAFTDLKDLAGDAFHDNWKLVEAILANRRRPATHQELLMDWPADREKPSPSLLYGWLNRAVAEKLVVRIGAGRRNDPFEYRRLFRWETGDKRIDGEWLDGDEDLRDSQNFRDFKGGPASEPKAS